MEREKEGERGKGKRMNRERRGKNDGVTWY